MQKYNCTNLWTFGHYNDLKQVKIKFKEIRKNHKTSEPSNPNLRGSPSQKPSFNILQLAICTEMYQLLTFNHSVEKCHMFTSKVEPNGYTHPFSMLLTYRLLLTSTGYNTKLYLAVRHQFWRFEEYEVTPSLLISSLWLKMVVLVRVPASDQIDLLEMIKFLTCLKWLWRYFFVPYIIRDHYSQVHSYTEWQFF